MEKSEVLSLILIHHHVISPCISLEFMLTSEYDRCVLELCYSRTSAIDSLLAFVTLACQLDGTAYAPAKILLSHERLHRVCSGRIVIRTAAPAPFTIPSERQKVIIHQVRELYAALFIISEDSYSGFWMRAVCVCALTMDLSFSLFGSSLSQSTVVHTGAVGSESLLTLAVERSFDDDPSIKTNQRFPVSKEDSRAEILGTSFLQMSSLLSERTLSYIYRNILQGIRDMAV